MPSDSKRITGPETTIPYHYYLSDFSRKPDFKDPKVGERKNGRLPNEHRPVFLKTGVNSQAKGSAYLEYENTKVICSVFDPREIPNKNEFSPMGELYCEFKFAPFSCIKRRGHIRDAEEKELSFSLRRALEPAVCRHEFPNFQVDIYVYILDSDGSDLAAAITCASLALADASVPMYDLVTAVSVGICGHLQFVDPTNEEEQLCKKTASAESIDPQAVITLTYMSTLEQVSEFTISGTIGVNHLEDKIPALIKHCNAIYPLLQQCLIKNVKKSLGKKKYS
nr:PREDICTED: exosome complex component MTR3-like [Bemisia tabaci]